MFFVNMSSEQNESEANAGMEFKQKQAKIIYNIFYFLWRVKSFAIF